VHVRFAGADVEGSPFTCRVYDARCIRVSEIPAGVLGKNVTFVVDASEAGVGNLEVAVNDGRVPSMAHSLGQHRYEISFVPREPTDHAVSIRFNREAVPGSPFTCHISRVSAPPTTTTTLQTLSVKTGGEGLERVPVGHLTTFTLETDGDGTQPSVDITDAQGNNVEAIVDSNGASTNERRGRVRRMSMELAGKGRSTVEYTPASVGSHHVAVFFGEQEIEASPFTVKVYDAAQVKLYPTDKCTVDKPCQFYSKPAGTIRERMI